MKNKFYVYAILVDGKIKYIGKGNGGRVKRHLKTVLRIVRCRAAGEIVRTTHFYNKLAKAWKSGSTITNKILFGGLSEKEALKLEIREIAKRRDKLWNVQPGGEHMDWNDQKFRKVATSKMRKAWRNPERMAAHLELCKRIHSDPKHKAALSKKAKEVNARPEMKAMLIKRNKSKKMRENWKKLSPKEFSALKLRLKLANEKRWADYRARTVH